jgi:hypothetical protein
MGTKRKPSLEDAGRAIYKIINGPENVAGYDTLTVHVQRYLIKQALEVWREVEKCI